MNLLCSRTVETLGVYYVPLLDIANILTRRDRILHRPSRDFVTDVRLLENTTIATHASVTSRTNKRQRKITPQHTNVKASVLSMFIIGRRSHWSSFIDTRFADAIRCARPG